MLKAASPAGNTGTDRQIIGRFSAIMKKGDGRDKRMVTRIFRNNLH
jgi:hypothetical protein